MAEARVNIWPQFVYCMPHAPTLTLLRPLITDITMFIIQETDTAPSSIWEPLLRPDILPLQHGLKLELGLELGSVETCNSSVCSHFSGDSCSPSLPQASVIPVEPIGNKNSMITHFSVYGYILSPLQWSIKLYNTFRTTMRCYALTDIHGTLFKHSHSHYLFIITDYIITFAVCYSTA